jgi:ketosteroid isomerase-like protein
MAATRGSYTMTTTGPATKKPVTDSGSYVTVFRKQKDGAWKAVLDINTSEAPPVAPPAPKAAVKKKKGKKR